MAEEEIEYIAKDENLPRDWFEHIVEQILSIILNTENRYKSLSPLDISDYSDDFLTQAQWKRYTYKLNLSPQDFAQFLRLTREGEIAIAFRVTGLFRLIKNCFSVITFGIIEENTTVIVENEYFNSQDEGIFNVLDLRFKSTDLPVPTAYNHDEFYGFGNISPDETIEIDVMNYDYGELLDFIGGMASHRQTKFFPIQKRLVEDIYLIRRIDPNTDLIIDQIALLYEFKPKVEIEDTPDEFVSLKISAPLTWFKMFLPFYEKML